MIVGTVVRHCGTWLVGLAAGICLFAGPGSAQARPVQPRALAAVAPVIHCSALVAADVSPAVGASTVVRSAAIVDDRQVAPYCSIKVVVDDYARFELRLPQGTWTQRLLFGGSHGARMAAGIGLDQFATVSWEDLGSRGKEDVFATDYHARINAAYRGMHLQVLAAKALIARFYGRGPRFSYYNACSEPGREGMMEVQRFPEDFDGVGAGCPPINDTVNNGLFYAWNVLTNTGPDGRAIITADKLPILHEAVVDQCDGADGVKDGIISDPFSCRPALAKIACPPGQDTSSCLTAAQIHAALELYRGAHDGQGDRLAPGGVLPGSELAWTVTIVPAEGGGQEEARAQTTTAIRSEFSDPALPTTWKLADLRFDRASFGSITRLRSLFDATDPDLSSFAKAGHKLILWQALGDTNVLPAHAILYYTALQRQMGAKTVEGFVRFYVLPGVHHCGGGDGPVITDLLSPLMLWVERGIAPGVLPGSHVVQPPRIAEPVTDAASRPAATPDLTRPIYPYPATSSYVGTGSVRDAASFVQGPARPAPAKLSNWLGRDFYSPGYMKWCVASGTDLRCKSSRP